VAEPAAPVQGASMEATCGQVRNLLRNPGFEKGRGELPDDWQRDAFIFREDLFAWVKNKSFRGRASVRVSIPLGMPNDARWIQMVPVEPHTRYRLSGWIKTRDVAHTTQLADVGANLSILDTTINSGFTFTPSLLGDHDWTPVSVEFDTGTNTQVTVAARVGMFAGITTGTAWFDDVRLMKVQPAR
jgi:hypothetical protein